MERIIYDRMADHDSAHWWYVARRDILADVIRRKIAPAPGARLLEIGCGTGHNLPMLQAFGTVDALEIDDAAAAIAAHRLGKSVSQAPLPALEGISDGAYDLIALLDVLEHIEDDHAALKSIAKRLKPGGRILLTVPQYMWMWSGHDVANHHFRRYTKRTLRAVIGAAGLKIDLLSHFNSLLFPLAAADRFVARVTGREGSDDALPATPLNAAFRAIFGIERHLVGRVPMPPGVSLIAVLHA
ncbi:MAG: methyltransferase domain-containing protein [Alphaproteobacteria bacterium]|nr:methyltransferase domain-containing protein [Alphaproteobacteria bacterium]MDE2341085.1 class I SAM-dependent methyltransferase [Alphaproteobacteria bacterium]